jgi:vitamin B12 transporter
MKYLFLLSCSVVVASPALAQGTKPSESFSGPWVMSDGEVVDCCIDGSRWLPEDEITVTATGIWTPRGQTGQASSVLTAADLETIQGADLTRALERLPGVTSARSGPLGSQTSLFVRGANSEQLVVTIDGVRVADAAAPSGGFDLGTLTAGGIGRIELQRGSNSLAWGSDAIGGVLAITSDQQPGLRADIEYGAHDTLVADAGFGLSGDAGSVGFSGGYVRSDGISAYAQGTEPDAFRQWRVNGRGALHLSDRLNLVASGRYADGRIDFDGYPAPLYAFADTGEYQITRQASGRLGLEFADGGIGDRFQLIGGIALSDTQRDYFDPAFGSAPNFETAGRSIHADLKGHARLTDNARIDFGTDAEWARFSTTFDPRRTSRTLGGHALLGYDNAAFSVTAGARFDDHDRFGSHWTLGANGTLELGEGWQARASWGQGFKAPTLYQLYGYGGNTALDPETSNAFDLGIERAVRGGRFRFAATLFRRDSENLIDYVSPTGYFNIGRTRAQGFELEANARASDRLTVRGTYSYVEAVNRSNGRDLARRPRHSLSASADWRTPLHDLALGADVRLAGDSFDDAGNFVRLDGYVLVTLRAALPLGKHLELFGRVENVGDAGYQTVAGYGTYGRSAYAGVRARF